MGFPGVPGRTFRTASERRVPGTNLYLLYPSQLENRSYL